MVSHRALDTPQSRGRHQLLRRQGHHARLVAINACIPELQSTLESLPELDALALCGNLGSRASVAPCIAAILRCQPVTFWCEAKSCLPILRGLDSASLSRLQSLQVRAQLLPSVDQDNALEVLAAWVAQLPQLRRVLLGLSIITQRADEMREAAQALRRLVSQSPVEPDLELGHLGFVAELLEPLTHVWLRSLCVWGPMPLKPAEELLLARCQCSYSPAVAKVDKGW